MEKIVEELNASLTDEKIIQDVQNLLNHATTRVIFPKKGVFPVDGEVSIVLKQFLDWRYDVVAPTQRYITVIVALGAVEERQATLGTVDASYGFVTLSYDKGGSHFRVEWSTSMWGDEEYEDDEE